MFIFVCCDVKLGFVWGGRRGRIRQCLKLLGMIFREILINNNNKIINLFNFLNSVTYPEFDVKYASNDIFIHMKMHKGPSHHI